VTTPRLRRLAGLAVASTLALSGCGLANPGVAARVGDDTITVRDVNEESDLICQAVEKDLQDPLPMSLARYQILTGQISRAIATQIAEEYDVSPGSDYTSAVAAAEVQVAAYPEETRDTLLTVTTTQTYVESILAEASKKLLAEEGLTDPTPDEITARSQELFATWPDSHPLDIDPRFGFEFVDGAYTSADTGVSVAVSDTAKAGQAEEPDPAVTALLPVSQRCG
jgi:hypothetical protein